MRLARPIENEKSDDDRQREEHRRKSTLTHIFVLVPSVTLRSGAMHSTISKLCAHDISGIAHPLSYVTISQDSLRGLSLCGQRSGRFNEFLCFTVVVENPLLSRTKAH
jgi:hypothetical protein